MNARLVERSGLAALVERGGEVGLPFPAKQGLIRLSEPRKTPPGFYHQVPQRGPEPLEPRRRNPSGSRRTFQKQLHSMLRLRSLCSWSKGRLIVRATRGSRHFTTQKGSGGCTRFRRRGLSSFTATASEGGENLKVPLSERAFKSELPLSSILSWYRVASQETKKVSAEFLEADDPTTKDLLRELDWLLEDTLERNWQTLRALSSEACRDAIRVRLSIDELEDLWKKRLHERAPLQYLTGAAHWRDLVLAVGPGVLIPRPETECLLDSALQAMAANPALAAGAWADLGTGSGALAIGLATSVREIPSICAVDKSDQAAAWAAFNSQRCGVADRVQVRIGSWFQPLQDLRRQLSGIVSNPPYIESQTLPGLQAEVRVHEPFLALDGGKGPGLDCLQQICRQAADFLVPGGYVGLETGGPQQARAVSNMLGDDFRSIQQRKDMFGIERFVDALRK